MFESVTSSRKRKMWMFVADVTALLRSPTGNEDFAALSVSPVKATDSTVENHSKCSSSDTQMGDGDEERWTLGTSASLSAPVRLMSATATGPAVNFKIIRKQLTSRALPWSHNSLWCPMSSFSTRFHPLQEASYNGDGIRHTAATEREQNTEPSQSKSQKFPKWQLNQLERTGN